MNLAKSLYIILFCAISTSTLFGMDKPTTGQPQEPKKSLERQILEQQLAKYDTLIATHEQMVKKQAQDPLPEYLQKSYNNIVEQRAKVAEKLKILE